MAQRAWDLKDTHKDIARRSWLGRRAYLTQLAIDRPIIHRAIMCFWPTIRQQHYDVVPVPDVIVMRDRDNEHTQSKNKGKPKTSTVKSNAITKAKSKAKTKTTDK